MTQVEMLSHQTQDAYDWASKLINTIPLEKWDEIPKNMLSSVSWQTGHLTISIYYHSIMVIKGHQMDLLQKIPVKEYNELYNQTQAQDTIGKMKPENLLNDLKQMQSKSLEIINQLQDENLNTSLEPTQAPHPIAKNKFEALDWNIKHTMWHCGQLAVLKRIVDKRYDFGLKK